MKKAVCIILSLMFVLTFSGCKSVPAADDPETVKVYVPAADSDPEQPSKGTVSGYITDNGAPVDGVTVTFGDRTVKSMRSGKFAMHSVEITDGKISFSKLGYFDYETTVLKTDFTDGTMEINVDFSRIATISGTVYDMNGNRLSGVTVSSGGQSVTTNSLGAYTITSVTADDGLITFAKEGYGSVTRLVRADWFDGDANVYGLETFMHRMAALSGSVIAPDGNGLAGVAVGCGSETVYTDDDGNYVLWVYPETDGTRANYRIFYEKEGYIPTETRVTFGSSYSGIEYEQQLNPVTLTPSVADYDVIESSTDSERLNMYGRTLYNSSENADEVMNIMSGFEVRFTGTWLSVEMKTLAQPRINPEKAMFTTWSVFVDGSVDPLEHQFYAESESWMTYSIVSGLKEGTHTVKVVKTDDPLISSCLVRNYRTDGEFLLKPDKPALKMEAYGDSITSGGDNLLFNNKPSEDVVPGNGNGAATYVSYSSYDLGADLSVFSRSGICLYGANPGDTVDVVSKIYSQYSPKNKNIWTPPAGYAPDIVVIGLGTNDQFGNMTGFAAAMEQFIRDLCSWYAKDDITFVLVHGFADLTVNNSGQTISPTIEECLIKVVEDMSGEYDVHRLKFDPAPRFHPLADEHRAAADSLTELLESLGY